MKAKLIDKETIRGFKYSPQTGMIYRSKVGLGMAKAGPCLATENSGYKTLRCKGRAYKQHRLAFLFMGVDLPRDKEVDHINGDRYDNRWSNLRLVDGSENALNHRRHREGRTPYVTFHKRHGWRVQKLIDGKPKHLGYFKTEQEAINKAKW